MAFTAQEKMNIMFVLGWPARTIIEGTTDYSKTAADRLVGLGDDAEALVRGSLAKVSDVDDRLEKAQARLAAKRVDTVETNPEEIAMLRKERMRYIREVSQIVGIEVASRNSSMIGISV